MYVRLIEPAVVDGRPRERGDVVEVEASKALTLIAMGDAVPCRGLIETAIAAPRERAVEKERE